MKNCSISAPFDPITQEELAWILDYRKAHGIREVVLVPLQQGIASVADRLKLLKKAVVPYRHLSVSERPLKDGIFIPEELQEGERIVRQGRYDKSARGIRKDLAERGIYFETSLDALCKPRRAAHSRSVAKVCREIAEVHGMDSEQAWKAGILHDITKAWSDEQGRQLLEVYDPSRLELDAKTWHSFTAPIFLKTVMGIQDRKILQAILTHTLGDGCTDLDYLLYIADKIEPTRGYDAAYETQLAKEDLKAAFDLVMKEAEEYRERRNNG